MLQGHIDIVVHTLSVLALWILVSAILIAVFVCVLAAGGWMGNAAASRDLPLLGCQDGGDPSTLPPRPSGNYTTCLIPL